MAAVPSWPSFRTVTLVALMTLSTFTEIDISKKLSLPGFESSSASIRLPPNWPTLWRSRTLARWTTKRARSLRSMKSPFWLWASGPVSRSAGSSISKALALPGGR